MSLSVSLQKQQDLLAAISEVLQSDRISKRTLLSLIGKLNHACQMIPVGRPFLRSLIDQATPLAHKQSTTRITKNTKSDLEAWKTFLDEWNGYCAITDPRLRSSFDLQLHTDASTSFGIGFVFLTRWSSVRVPLAKVFKINYLEFLAIVSAIFTHQDALSGLSILVHSDNTCAVSSINKMRSRNRHTNALAKDLFLLCAKRSIRIRAQHIPGIKNSLADAASRGMSSQAMLRIATQLNHTLSDTPLNAVVPPAYVERCHGTSPDSNE
jgi:hypothetical protein